MAVGSKSPAVGQVGPDFTIDGTSAGGATERYHLADYRGRPVVLAFYPGDDTAVCTKQLNDYNEGFETFNELDAQVFGISRKGSSHAAFSAKYGFQFPLLADTDKAVAGAYGTLGPLGFPRRSVFILDADGVVRYAHRAIAGLTFRPTTELVDVPQNALTALTPGEFWVHRASFGDLGAFGAKSDAGCTRIEAALTVRHRRAGLRYDTNLCSQEVAHVGVLGIDPGLTRCGYAVIDDVAKPGPVAVSMGVIRTPPSDPLPQRLAALRAELAALMSEFRPDAVAVEHVFFQVNVRTAMSVGQASGLALAEAAACGCEVAQYTPNEVKGAVAGYGAATKEQVQKMVQARLRLANIPKPPDAADAAALALCHLASAPLRQRLAAAR